MNNDDLYQDSTKIIVTTPYQKLREQKGWTLQIAADFLQIGATTLNRYETKKAPIPKKIIKQMDDLYQCKGKLIEYWWTSELSGTARLRFIINNSMVKVNMKMFKNLIKVRGV